MIVDDREKKAADLLGAADEVIRLRLGDIEVTLPDGRTLRFERKRLTDYVATFTQKDGDGSPRLARQVKSVDGIVVEFDADDLLALEARYEHDPRDPLGRAMKRLARMSAPEGEYAGTWVIFSLSPKMTADIMRYIERGRATRSDP